MLALPSCAIGRRWAASRHDFENDVAQPQEAAGFLRVHTAFSADASTMVHREGAAV